MRSGVPLPVLALLAATACGGGSGPPPALSKTTFSIQLQSRPDELWPPLVPCPPSSGSAGAGSEASGAGSDTCPDYTAPVVVDCNGTSGVGPLVGVTASVENFYLRTPDACGSVAQCGFLSVAVDPPDDGGPAPASAIGVGPNLVLDLSPLAQAGTLAGPHVLSAELLRADGKLYTGPYAAAPIVLAGVSFVCRGASSN